MEQKCFCVGIFEKCFGIKGGGYKGGKEGVVFQPKIVKVEDGR